MEGQDTYERHLPFLFAKKIFRYLSWLYQAFVHFKIYTMFVLNYRTEHNSFMDKSKRKGDLKDKRINREEYLQL